MNTSLLNCCNICIFSRSLLIFKVECSRIYVFPIHVIIFSYISVYCPCTCIWFFWHMKCYDSLSYICKYYLLIILSNYCRMTTICLESCLIFWLSLINFLITICAAIFFLFFFPSLHPQVWSNEGTCPLSRGHIRIIENLFAFSKTSIKISQTPGTFLKHNFCILIHVFCE